MRPKSKYRVRYILKSAMGNDVLIAIICHREEIAGYKRRIRDVGYKLVGVDKLVSGANGTLWEPVAGPNGKKVASESPSGI